NGRGADRDFEVMRKAVARFIGRIGRRPVAVALADPPQLVATFDDDRMAVLDKLEKAGRSESTDGLLDAVVAAAHAIQDTGSLFSSIVVVTSDPQSKAPAEFLTPVLASGATVHAVVAQGSTPSTAPESLRAVADQTSGRLTSIFAAA